MLTIDSLTFDLTNCELRKADPNSRAWLSSDIVAHLLRFREGPPSWNFDLRNPQAAKDFYGQQCEENAGAMLFNEVFPIAGHEALCGVFKYRAPAPNNMAMLYVGIIWIPFANYNYQLNVEAMEQGTTGTREAGVMLMEPELFPEQPDAPVVAVKSAEEMFVRMKAAKVRALPSDDMRFDTKFPDHPLSLVRKRLGEIIDTIKLNANGEVLAPFRIS
jgi:hypothetical protein